MATAVRHSRLLTLVRLTIVSALLAALAASYVAGYKLGYFEALRDFRVEVPAYRTVKD